MGPIETPGEPQHLIYNWSRDWAIKFNPNKTESVLFTRKNNVDYHNVYFGNPDNIVTDVEMHCHRSIICKKFYITSKF
jgi:hypothetical protein